MQPTSLEAASGSSSVDALHFDATQTHACIHQGLRPSNANTHTKQVANNKKQLLDGDHPLVLSLPADVSDNSRGYGATAATPDLSLLDASVGPELKWTLSSINHVLRTV